MTGPKWGRYYVGPLQFMVCYGAVIASTLLGGQCMKVNHLIPFFFFFFVVRSGICPTSQN